MIITEAAIRKFFNVTFGPPSMSGATGGRQFDRPKKQPSDSQ
jgi:hypothetical protein